MSEIVRAADLPEGSIVADRRNAWIKRNVYYEERWRETGLLDPCDNAFIDQILAAGGVILVRYGYGN